MECTLGSISAFRFQGDRRSLPVKTGPEGI
jgi:hypothetical protein